MITQFNLYAICLLKYMYSFLGALVFLICVVHLDEINVYTRANLYVKTVLNCFLHFSEIISVSFDRFNNQDFCVL